VIKFSGQKTENVAIGIRHADHMAPSIYAKLALSSPTSGGCSIGIVRSETQAMEFSDQILVGLVQAEGETLWY
jgi:hypothetical protein